MKAMKVDVYIARDPNRPGVYIILIGPEGGGFGSMVERVPWPAARVRMEPEAYAYAARASFADWCHRNGY